MNKRLNKKKESVIKYLDKKLTSLKMYPPKGYTLGYWATGASLEGGLNSLGPPPTTMIYSSSVYCTRIVSKIMGKRVL